MYSLVVFYVFIIDNWIKMDHKEEYHDPDYPEVPVSVKDEAPIISEEDKIEKIKQIIQREFRNELNARENEVKLIDQRLVYFKLANTRY